MGVDNGNVARRYLNDVWAKGNLDAVDELVDDNVVMRDNMGTDIRGKAKLNEMVSSMRSTFSDNAFTIEDVIVSEDRVVIRSVWRGTHSGDFFGIAGTGRTLTCAAVDVLRIANGKVIEDIGYMDSYSMFQQLGALPEREKLAKSGGAMGVKRERVTNP